MRAVAFFGQQVAAVGLVGVDDLGEAVVVVGRFDEDLVVIAIRGGSGSAALALNSTGNSSGAKTWRGATRRERRDARRIPLDEGVVGLLLGSVVAVRREIDVQPAALREIGGRDVDLGVGRSSRAGAASSGWRSAKAKTLPQLISSGLRLKPGHLAGVADRAVVAVVGDWRWGCVAW